MTVADETVASWMTLSPDDRAELSAKLGSTPPVHVLKSGGFLVDLGDAFPVWREDMGAVRRLLLERDMRAITASRQATS